MGAAAAETQTLGSTSTHQEEDTLMKRSQFCLRQQLLSRTASLMFVAMIALIAPSLAHAQSTLVVDDDGQGTATSCNAGAPAFSSIQAAVNAAAPGDTILICPGTYDEQVETI
jgi:pectin methylesterase-like acyl-CoA thioesterase